VTDLHALKTEAAREALKSIADGMVVGLGTGSTSEEFIKLLGDSIARGALRDIEAVCTSIRTEELARSLRIPILPLDRLERIDVAVDGADEIDPNLRLIKGRGGALLREKIVEQASAHFIVIADHTKEVERLGQGPLPVAIVPFAQHLLERRLEVLDLNPRLRHRNGAPFVTDDGLYILDLTIPRGLEIAEVVGAIYWFAGIVETGFFPEEASEAIIAAPDGLRHRRRPGVRVKT